MHIVRITSTYKQAIHEKGFQPQNEIRERGSASVRLAARDKFSYIGEEKCNMGDVTVFMLLSDRSTVQAVYFRPVFLSGCSV